MFVGFLVYDSGSFQCKRVFGARGDVIPGKTFELFILFLSKKCSVMTVSKHWTAHKNKLLGYMYM